MSAPPNRHSRTAFPPSVDPKRLGDGSLLGDTLMRQARRMAPNLKSDTTHTNYFKLKAMGLDPDTPIVPATSKRPSSAKAVSGTSEANNKGHAPPSGPPAGKVQTNHQADDDEDLFASIRAVRETLADSTSWFQSERASLERSITPRTSATPQDKSKTIQTGLRETRSKPRTPTRTELRNRAMGDKSLFPDGFWDSPGSATKDSSKENDVRTDEARDMKHSPKPMGFTALARHGHLNGRVDNRTGDWQALDAGNGHECGRCHRAIAISA